jgi:hypothetical protein
MSKYNKTPGIIEMILTIIVALFILLAKSSYRLMRYLFVKSNHHNNGLYQVKPVANLDKYELRECLLTPAEKDFLSVLEQIVGDRYIIEKQVPVSRIINTQETDSHSYFNRIKAKSIDFVLFNKDYSPYLCIELDDNSHLRWDRIKRDVFIDDLLKSVGLRIIHVRVAYSYDGNKLSSQIFNR